MTLKLNHSEMLAITALLMETSTKYANVITQLDKDRRNKSLVPFGKVQHNDEGDIMEVYMYKSIFEELWVKFQKKSFETQKKYSVDIKPHQLAAIHIEFNGLLDVTSYTGNLIQKICNNIHQQFQTT